jgi:hypothetical protein
MRLTRNRRQHVAALLTLLAFLTLAPRSLAADPDWPGETGDGWRKMLAYGRCALGVFAAVTPPQWGAALVDCTRLFLSEPPLNEGGR